MISFSFLFLRCWGFVLARINCFTIATNTKPAVNNHRLIADTPAWPDSTSGPSSLTSTPCSPARPGTPSPPTGSGPGTSSSMLPVSITSPVDQFEGIVQIYCKLHLFLSSSNVMSCKGIVSFLWRKRESNAAHGETANCGFSASRADHSVFSFWGQSPHQRARQGPDRE